ncbi:hypothetical protein ABPG74_012773 [Tetrahymena malaccensis]
MSLKNFESSTHNIEYFYVNENEYYNEFDDQNPCSRIRQKLNDQNQQSTSLNSKITNSSQKKENLQELNLHQQTESTNYGQIEKNNLSSEKYQNQINQKCHLSFDSCCIQGESNIQNNQYYQQDQNPDLLFSYCCNLQECSQNDHQDQVIQPYFIQNSNQTNIIEEPKFIFTNQDQQYIDNEYKFEQTQINPNQLFDQFKVHNQHPINQNITNDQQKLNSIETQNQASDQPDFWSHAKLRAKQRNKNAYSKKYQCSICINKIYANHSGLTNHKNKKHKEKKTSEIQVEPNITKGRPPKNRNKSDQQIIETQTNTLVCQFSLY